MDRPSRRLRTSTAAAAFVLSIAISIAVAACSAGGSTTAAGPGEQAAGPPPEVVELLDALPPPGQPAGGALSTYVGAVPGTDALLAVTITGDATAVAYLCDGATTATWFSGDVADGGGTLSGLSSPETLQVTIGDGQLDAELTVDGITEPVSLRTAAPGEGLFRETAGDSVGGWIVADRELRGALKTGKEITAGASENLDTPSLGDEADPGSPPPDPFEPEPLLFGKRKACRNLAGQLNQNADEIRNIDAIITNPDNFTDPELQDTLENMEEGLSELTAERGSLLAQFDKKGCNRGLLNTPTAQ